MDKILKNIKLDDNGCWIWQKSVSGAGYGQLTVNGKYWSAHKYSYTLKFGPVDSGTLLRHTCHNRKCCNPDHLVTGTHLDNWHDSRETHLGNASKRRGTWGIQGTTYATVRDAQTKTGLSMAALIKHTENGIFNVIKYREACKVARKTPKI